MDFISLRPREDFVFLAEAGVNHEGSVEEAIKMVEAAAQSGADAIKFQAYIADKLAHKKYAKSYWDEKEEATQSQHKLFSKYKSFTISEWERIKKACEINNIEFWLSIFDLELAKSLYQLCDGLKVASGDITFKRLHDFVLDKKIPSIFSTGASNESEINILNEKIKDKNSISLFCRLSYPTADLNAEYGMFSNLSKKYKSLKGISDHCKTLQGESVILAFTLGAVVVEKHFTLTPNIRGNDHYHSITPEILRSTLKSISRMRDIYKVKSNSIPTKSESQARKGARRSLFYTSSLNKGHLICEKDIIELRPVVGVEASAIKEVIGKELVNDVCDGDPVNYSHLK